ncbi:hypothetical protein SAMN05660830_02199 [Halodesulfovibrio aestuarii]|uniref:Tetratricopeptide repeat protein n=2 Tax=Halodesulfovibrio aestuarii TaxID=126333 RepID=A0A8G2CAJ0_9BACT|nr:hypothetical protein SAMN05660830_02199 [Halodesulfovibrio aestuarii]
MVGSVVHLLNTVGALCSAWFYFFVKPCIVIDATRDEVIMSRQWIEANREEFARDILRDFCMVSSILEKQFIRFADSGAVSFTQVRDLLGSTMNKGLLWRLKDTAHHLLRTDAQAPVVAKALDWAISYVFHECIKLKEDAYQQQHYAPMFKALEQPAAENGIQDVVEPFSQLLGETRESMSREIARISFLLARCNTLFCIYCAHNKKNLLVARLLFSRNSLVKRVFGKDYDTLISSIYGTMPEEMYILAAEGLLEGGRLDEALEAATEAEQINPACTRAATVRQKIEELLKDSSPRRVKNCDLVSSKSRDIEA